MRPKGFPRLKKNDFRGKFLYKLTFSARARRKSLNEYIRSKSRNRGIRRDVAIKKKRRLNVLRIFRKNTNKSACRKITNDMRYLDKKYRLGSTNSIC